MKVINSPDEQRQRWWSKKSVTLQQLHHFVGESHRFLASCWWSPKEEKSQVVIVRWGEDLAGTKGEVKSMARTLEMRKFVYSCVLDDLSKRREKGYVLLKKVSFSDWIERFLFKSEFKFKLMFGLFNDTHRFGFWLVYIMLKNLILLTFSQANSDIYPSQDNIKFL